MKLTILWGLLHFGLLMLVTLVLFLASHVPPKAVNLDGLILAVFHVQVVLAAPRKFLLWVWPGELTPGWLGLLSMAFNSAVWGASLAALKLLWEKATA